MAIPISSSYSAVDPNLLFYEGFELAVDSLIPTNDFTSSFDQNTDKVEFYIYNTGKKLLYQNQNFQDYIVSNNTQTDPNSEYPTTPQFDPNSGDVDGRGNTDVFVETQNNPPPSFNALEVDPIVDVYNQGYGTGTYYAVYNFIHFELGSSEPYFISEISPDRTEIRIKNNFILNTNIEGLYNEFRNKLDSNPDFDEFYVDFGDNKYFICINSDLEIADNAEASILIKLYKPLPSTYKLLDTLSIKTKVGETNAYEIKFTEDLGIIDDLIYLKGPNTNISLNDRINNSTEYKTLQSLNNAKNTGSLNQFRNLKQSKGAQIRVNYDDYASFVHFSSAEQRLRNFYEKRVLLEGYEKELNDLNTITGTAVGTAAYSSSKEAVETKIQNIVEKFDGYDYYLMYLSGSSSWPKQSNTLVNGEPYPLYSYTSSQVKNWFGSTDENDPFFGTGKNQIYSASLYDENNKDYLKNVLPGFITSDSNNEPYFKFIGMTGQMFDEMWLYTEAIGNLRNTSNLLTGSVLPVDLASQAIEGLGFDTYGNSFNSQLFDPADVGTTPPTGSGKEYITRYVDAASGSIVNYYDDDFTTLGYVIQLANTGFPFPVDGPQREIYKRIFASMVSLIKRKGTITGLRQLINIWGVPSTVLRISEFGGKNKNDEGDYDLWMNRHSTAFTTYPNKKQSDTIYTDTNGALGIIKTPWFPLTKDYYEAGGTNEKANLGAGTTNGGTFMADSIQFRFKTATKVGTDTHFSESLMYCYDDTNAVGNFGIMLEYSGSATGSYSGSIKGNVSDPYQTYASMSFVISGSTSEGADGAGYYKSSPIYLPFYNGDWWTVQLQRHNHITASISTSTNAYTLKVGQKGYEGYDGNQLKYQGSTTLTDGPGGVSSSMHQAWNHGAGNGIGFNGAKARREGDAGFTHLYFPRANYKTWSQTAPTAIIGQAPTLTSNKANLGQHFSGSYQEIRYYTTAVSQSSFNDFVMNPESIQGQNGENTGRGRGTSYYNVAYRVPLGNENEYSHTNIRPLSRSVSGFGLETTELTFGSQSRVQTPSTNQTHNASIGSLHPSVVNHRGSLFTSSFIITNPGVSGYNNEGYYATSSQYQMLWPSVDFGNLSSSLTASFIEPQDEVVYMDQPSAGIRNRISNKIEVIDGNSYGSILTPQRSIQQNPVQSQSYTENLNSLEVGFSFQNEISDDIIATYGHGVVSDAIADPRLISQSLDRYPELDRIAKDYFLKYQGPIGQNNINPYWNLPSQVEREWDYNRLIKFYESSLFKAIKNYIPARTSLSTGIVVKQHLLERNRQIPAQIQIGQDMGVATSETEAIGYNQFQTFKNLEVTGSTPSVINLVGGAGGSVNNLNTNLDPHFSASLNNIWAPSHGQTGFDAILNISSTVAGGDVNQPTTEWTIVGAATTELANKFTKSSRKIRGHADKATSFFQASQNIKAGYVYFEINTSANDATKTLEIRLRSNRRGVILQSKPGAIFNGPIRTAELFPGQSAKILPSGTQVAYMYPEIELFTDEKIYIEYKAPSGVGTGVISTVQLQLFTIPPLFLFPSQYYNDIYSARYGTNNQGWLNAIDTPVGIITGSSAYHTSQDEFYNGEYSGSNLRHKLDEYNPYRIYADGSDLLPDTTPTFPAPVVDATAGSVYAGKYFDITANSFKSNIIRAYATASIEFKAMNDNTMDKRIGITGSNNAKRDFQIIAFGSTMGLNGYISNGGWSPKINVDFPCGSPSIVNEYGIEVLPQGGGSFTDGTFNVTFAGYALLNLGNTANGMQLNADVTVSGGQVVKINVKWFDGVGVTQNSTDLNMGAATSANKAILFGPNTISNGKQAYVRFHFYGAGPGLSQGNGTHSFVGKGFWVRNVVGGSSAGTHAATFKAAFKIGIEEDYNTNSIVAADQFTLSLAKVSGSLGGLVRGAPGATSTEVLGDSGDNVFNFQVTDGFNPGYGGAGANNINTANDFANNSSGVVYLTPSGTSFNVQSPTSGNGTSGAGRFVGNVADPGSSAWYINPVATGIVNNRTYRVRFTVNTIVNDGGDAAGNNAGNMDAGFSTIGGFGMPSTVGQFRTSNNNTTPASYEGFFTATGNGNPQFFVASGVSASISSITIDDMGDTGDIHKKHIEQYSDITVLPTRSIIFDNSEYNATINNVSESRENTYLMDMDFETNFIGTDAKGDPFEYQGLSKNYVAISKSQAPKAQIPDSFFTQQASILPRYNGSRLLGLDYNNYNYPSFLANFLNGDSGSWEGDISYGTSPVISSHPIYFAHFKSSHEARERFGKTVFEIDQLIEVPFEPLTGNESPSVEPIFVAGNNTKVQEVVSTFVDDRKVAYLYNDDQKIYSNQNNLKVSYKTISPTPKTISAAATSFKPYMTNQINETKMYQTQSLLFPQWLSEETTNNSSSIEFSTAIGDIAANVKVNQIPNVNIDTITGPAAIFGSTNNNNALTNGVNFTQVGIPHFQTGSTYAGEEEGYGILKVLGPTIALLNFIKLGNIDFLGYQPILMVANSQNHAIYNGSIIKTTDINDDYYQPVNGWRQANRQGAPMAAYTSSVIAQLYGTAGGQVPTLEDNIQEKKKFFEPKGNKKTKEKPKSYDYIAPEYYSSYWRNNLAAYNTDLYGKEEGLYDEFKEIPFMIERGDVIRVSYRESVISGNSKGQSNIMVQDFEVLGYEQPCPILLVNRAGSGREDWLSMGTGQGPTAGMDFRFVVNQLPRNGFYSPEGLMEKLNLMVKNKTVTWFGSHNTSVIGQSFSAMPSGSVIKAEILDSLAQGIAHNPAIDTPTSGAVAITVKILYHPGASQNINLGSNNQRPWGTSCADLWKRWDGSSATLEQVGSRPNQAGNETLCQPAYIDRHGFAVDSGSWNIFGFDPSPGSKAITIDPAFLYDMVKVTPDPSKLKNPIPFGSIYSYTLIKREQVDNKIYVDLVQPTGSRGASTPTGDGFLIPEDLSLIQKDNVQKIINQLKSKNSFDGKDSTAKE